MAHTVEVPHLPNASLERHRCHGTAQAYPSRRCCQPPRARDRQQCHNELQLELAMLQSAEMDLFSILAEVEASARRYKRNLILLPTLRPIDSLACHQVRNGHQHVGLLRKSRAKGTLI